MQVLATTYEKRMMQQPKKDKRVWVKVGVVKEVTVWNNYKDMEKARNNNLVVWDERTDWIRGKKVRAFYYDLNSINPLFLKK